MRKLLQTSHTTKLITLTIFHSLFQILKAQGGCGNPLAKLYEDVNMLGTAVSYNTSHIECINVLNITCCDNAYHVELSNKFNEKKANQIDYWDRFFILKATEFLESYILFLDWFDEKEAKLNKEKKKADIEFYQNLIKTIQTEKERCFNQIWKHTASMRCYVCLSNYTTYFNQLRNKTIEMFMSEDVCQVMEEKCTSYTGKYVHLVEKAKYLYQFIRTTLNVPNFSDSEITTINEFEDYIKPMYTCNTTGLCREICSNFLSGTGYNGNYTMPYVMYFEWFVDGFRTLKKTKAKEEEANGGHAKIAVKVDEGETTQTNTTTTDTSNTTTTNGTGTTRVLLEDGREFHLGVIKPSIREWRFLNEKQKRILETAFEKYKRLSQSYSSVPVYSNSYTLNTITLYDKLKNLSYVDETKTLNSKLKFIIFIVGLLGFEIIQF